MTPAVSYVAQRETYDCQVAVCAMILGISYEEAHAFYTPKRSETRGYSELFIDNILVEHGWAIARKYHTNCAAGQKREPWPPEPWADLHFAHVETNLGGHAIVVLRDGTALDPATPAPRRFADYPKVLFLAAVARIA